MKHETIPYPRQFGPTSTGIDCRAVKRALAHWGSGPHGMMNLRSIDFGRPAQVALKTFKEAHSLLGDPIYTLQAHEALRRHFDLFGASLMAKAANSHAAQTMREQYVHTWRWMLGHHVHQNYHQWRPIPENLPPFETHTTINTDCSGETEICARWVPGCPDPSGLFFNGQGNTGSLLGHGTKIAIERALPADLIVYRSSTRDNYGHHVVAILERISSHDFHVGSMGHQGDPGEYRHSDMAASQARSGYGTATFVRWLPAPTVVLS